MEYDGETFYVTNIFGEPPQIDGSFLSPGTIEYPALAVGSIRIVDSEADLATLDAKAGDAAYVRGEAGLYKYMDAPPFVTTYDVDGDPVQTEIDPVSGTTNWYRTTDAADILADSITASHLQVETLDAISANLGDVTAGTVQGVVYRSDAPGNARVEIHGTGDDSDAISFKDASNDTLARITGAAGGLTLTADVFSFMNGSVVLDAALPTLIFGSFVTGPRIITGSGSPGGVVSAPPGSIYLRTDDTSDGNLYVKQNGSGNTGWVEK